MINTTCGKCGCENGGELNNGQCEACVNPLPLKGYESALRQENPVCCECGKPVGPTFDGFYGRVYNWDDTWMCKSCDDNLK